MAISAEQLNIILNARDKEFTKAMDRSQKRVERFASRSSKGLSKVGNSFDSLGRTAKRLVPLLGAAFSARAITNLTNTTAEIGKLASLSGTGVVEFQRFAAGARTVGIEMGKSADIIKDVSDKIGDFIATGGGPMADFFENIAPAVGVTAEQFMNLSGPQALGLYVDSLDKANLSQAEMVFYMEALASDSTALLPLLRNNGRAMKVLGDEAERTGRILDEDAVKGARDLEQEMADLSETITRQVSDAIFQHKDELMSVVDFITEKAIPGFAALIEALEKAGNLYRTVRGFETGGPGAEIDPSVREADVAAAGALGGGDPSNTGLFYVDEDGNVREFGENGPTTPIPGVTAPATPGPKIKINRPGLGDPKDSPTGGVIDSIEELKDRYRDLIGTLDDAVGRNNEYKDTVDLLDEALSRGAITQDQYNTGLELAKKRFHETTFEASNLADIMQTVQGSLESAFMSMIDGTQSAKGAFKSMASEIIKELYRVLVVQRLVSAITGAFGGFGMTTGTPLQVPSGSGASLLPPRASGGTVRAGQAYMTGESGRELFVPKTDGRILSPAQTSSIGGGGGVVVNQTINVSTGVQQTVRTEIKSLMPQIAESAKSAVVDAKRRGGSYGRSFA